MGDTTRPSGVNPASEDVAFDDLPPTKVEERNDPEAFLAADDTDEARPDNADGIGDAPAAGDPVPGSFPFAPDYREGVVIPVSEVLSLLGRHGHTGRPNCPACAKEDAESEGETRDEAPDISVPGARVRFHPLPKRRVSGGLLGPSTEGSPGYVLVVDNAEDADDPEVQTNWLGVAAASGALTLIISPDEIDLGGGLAEIADRPRAMTGGGKR